MVNTKRLSILCLSAFILSSGFSLFEFVAQKKYALNMPKDVAALVNGNEIKKIDYLTAITLIAEDKRDQMNTVDYKLVIDRLIEEELLFQYALKEDVLYDANITQLVISNMLSSIVSDITSDDYSEAQIEAFFNTQKANNAAFKHAMQDQIFEKIKDELASAMFEINNSKAIRAYLSILNNKAMLTYSSTHPVSIETQVLRESL